MFKDLNVTTTKLSREKTIQEEKEIDILMDSRINRALGHAGCV